MARAGVPFLLVACVAAACSRGAVPAPEAARYDYVLAPPAAGSWSLDVEATFEHAATAHLVAPEAGGAVADVRLAGAGGEKPLASAAEGWWAPECRARCVVRYRVSLDRLASDCDGFDCPQRVGGAILGPASTWMLRPDSGDALVRVAVEGPGAGRFATGLRRDGRGGYVARESQLTEASYTAFGAMRRARARAAGAEIDVALLGAPLAMGDAAAVGWVGRAAGCVAGLFGRFPVDATVFVVPVAGASQVVFGRVLSLAGASAALFFGAETPASAQPRDWVVVHELFHLGTPSFLGPEGAARWLEEGLATYYEPILRERAGWTSEADLWRHFVSQMPRGLRRPGEAAALAQRDDIDSTYWGGALFALLADLAVRRATAGARSLDDALRAALARLGDATHRARVSDFLRIGDEATGTRALHDVYARYAVGGESVDLDALWRSLGVASVVSTGALDERAPEASLRRAIGAGGPH